MMLTPSPKQQFFDNNGRPLDGGLLFTYLAGTNTKVATYQNEAGTPNTNPIVLDFRGEANIWLDPLQTYKYVLAPRNDTDPPTNPIWSVDDITALGLTQEIIGELLWPETEAETAAGVTIVNFARPPGDFVRYGFSPLASATLNTTAANAAVASNSFAYCHDPGTYQVNDNISVQSGQTIEFSQGVTIQSAASVAWIDTGILDIVGRENVTIIGGVIDGNKANNATGRCFGVKVFSSAKVTLIDVTCQNMPGIDATGNLGGDGVVVYGDGSADFKMVGCSMFNNVRQGLSLVEVTGAIIDGCVFRGTTGSNPGAGIDIEGDDPANPLRDITVTGCVFQDNQFGIQVTSFSEDVTVVGNVFDGNRVSEIYVGDTTRCVVDGNIATAGASVDGSPVCRIISAEDVIFCNNHIKGTGANTERQGLLVESSSNVTVNGNEVRDTYRSGIQIGTTAMTADVDNVSVCDNVLHNCVEAGAASVAVILITGNSGGGFYPLRLMMSGNRIRDTRGGGDEADYAMEISTAIPAATSANYRVSNNMTSGTGSVIPSGTELPQWGSTTWNPTSLSNGTGETSPGITVTGAAIGDAVAVYPPYDLEDLTYSGYVQAANTVEIRIQNGTGGNVDLGSGVWRVRVSKPFA